MNRRTEIKILTRKKVVVSVSICGKTLRKKMSTKILFCFKTCFDLLLEKKCAGDREKLEAEGREFANLLKSLEQFF